MTESNTTRKLGRKFTSTEARVVKALTPGPGDRLLKLVTSVGKLGDQPPLRSISAAIAVAGLATGNARLLRAGARMLLAHEATTSAKDVIKVRIDRTRPRSASSHAERKVKPGTSTAKEETSFPSGHSAGSFAVARAFSREFPEYQGAALAAAGAVAAAQVPRCAHYPTDVGAGILLGIATEAVTNAAFNKAEEYSSDADATLEARPPLPLPA